MDFDRNAIGSLEDVHREWDSLETERARVEDKLRSFDAPAGGRGGGFGGRGVRVMGGGRGRDRSDGGDWRRDRPRDTSNGGREEAPHRPSQASRDKYRAMSGTWERGLDPATAALDDDSPPEGRGRGGSGTAGLRGGTKGSIAHYQRPADSHGDRRGRGRDRGVAPMHGAGVRGDRDGMRGDRTGDRDVFSRGGRSGTRGDRARGDFDRFRNGSSGGRGEGARARRESNGVGGGGVEPEAKRPRVTSTIVVAGDEDTNGDGTTENGELDRWNTELPPASPPPEAEAAAATETAATTTTTPDDDLVDYEPEAEPEEDTASGPPPAAAAAAPPGEATGQEGDQQPMEEDDDGGRRPVGKIVVVSGGGPRGRAANIGGVAGSGGGRGSLASRLGPPMGRPVMVKGGSGDNSGEGGFVPLSERPMPEPSKPELHVAYKDGDTKKRNRRMFGGLMAHLGRARQQLDHDKSIIQRQKSVVEMAAIRQAQEKRQRRQTAETAAREERDEELHKRDYIRARQQKTLVALHGNGFIANQEQLKGFIFTKTLPKLAWSPNEHTDVTQALLADSSKEIDGNIERREEADDKEFQKIDDSVAERAATRASRRMAHAPGGRQMGVRQDRDANSHGEGNGHRWQMAAGESDTNGEGPGQARTVAQDDGDGNAGATEDTGGASSRSQDVVDDADQPGAAVLEADGGEGREMAGGAGDGMEVDGDDVGVATGLAEADDAGVQEGPETSPRRSLAPAAAAGGDLSTGEEENNGGRRSGGDAEKAGGGGGGGDGGDGVDGRTEAIAEAIGEEEVSREGGGGDTDAEEGTKKKKKSSKKDRGSGSGSGRKKSSRRSSDK
ncbi:unnamed protein product [Ectocarpus sp. 6 AP-2014]